MEIRFPQTRG